MNIILDNRLCKQYPEIFRDRYEDMTKTAMCWGFDCDDGWYDIIDELCKNIMLVKGDKIPKATQVKEKYGTLRFYIDHGDNVYFDLIINAEEKSEKTCEICGKKGKLRDKNSWFKTLCKKDTDKLNYN